MAALDRIQTKYGTGTEVSATYHVLVLAYKQYPVSTPQATPKHLTDEELRQQYGIQLASRPQEGGDGKEAKWADIDDDEDDWAPETIEWNDGTKINLSQVESSPITAEQPVSLGKEEEKEPEPPKPTTPVVKPTTVGPNPKVLKLGSGPQAKPNSNAQKGSSEKPTLVAKPTSSTPVKSPWATLPAVEKVPPVAINPPAQQPPPRFGQRDAHGFDAMPPPPPAQAKEIAADDFSRFSRDTQNGLPRELYNSQSGRYEPVNETRRQVVRKDQNYRQPSVLQRPSPTDNQGPAEPSPAFQTHRSHQDSGAWDRRRTMSNASGESGKFGRRMSSGRGFDAARAPPEVLQRKDSQTEQQPFAPSASLARAGRGDVSPVNSRGQSITSKSPALSAAQMPLSDGIGSGRTYQVQTSAAEGPSSLPVGEDALATQRRLMRESREAAIKRKKEEEEREQAEKEERIRQKLKNLPPTEDSAGKKDDAVSSTSPKATLKEPSEVTETLPQSPPKPPIPNASGQPQQYGLMKVHARQTLSSIPITGAGAEQKTTVDGSSPTNIKSDSPDESVPHVNGRSPRQEQEPKPSHPADNYEKGPLDVRQPWPSVQQPPSTVYPGWGNGTNSMTTHSQAGGNPWGPPPNHRTLGNGDFQNNLQRAQVRQPQPQYSHLISPPQPIGTPRQGPQQRSGPVLTKSSETITRSISEEMQPIPAFPSESVIQAREPTPTSITSTNQGPPLAASSKMSSGVPLQASAEPPKNGISAWNNFAANIATEEAKESEKAAREYAARMTEQRLNGVTEAPNFPKLNETWKQVKRGDGTGTRQIIGSTKTQRNDPVIDESSMIHQNSPIPPIRSRYQDIFDQGQRAVSAPLDLSRPASPSPPPPDSESHPAFTSVAQRPLVKLPGMQHDRPEKPIVRLPPTSPSALKKLSTTAPGNVASPARVMSQPLLANPTWQDRFNGLLNRKSSPEKKPNDNVDFSISKVPLELTSTNYSTFVTLPPPDDSDKTQDIPTKSVEDEDALFEERDFGSVPIIRVPAMAPPSAWTPAREPVTNSKRVKASALRDIDVFSAPVSSHGHEELTHGGGLSMRIFLPGMTEPKFKKVASPASSTPSRSSHLHSSRGRARPNHKPRDAPSSRGALHPAHHNSPRANAQSPAGNPKPRSKITNGNASWAGRVSGVVS